MKHSSCPSCRHTDPEDFFRIPKAPVHSVVTIKNRDDALAVPREDIVLSVCPSCGFIFNSAFDTSIDYVSQQYDDQQGFSPTFVNFITGVTGRFIDRYDVRGKTVVEIGCGKGDFLRLICGLGENRGIGIDPAFLPGRTEEMENVRFIKEFYSEKHGGILPDCIICRHTLEHIHDTAAFMNTVRKSIGDSKPVLLFEVPNVVRILEVQAFWDIFYEHCSYFSPGAIGRLFRQSGFEVLDMHLAYDNQYLFVEARPVDVPSVNVHPLEEPVEALRAKIPSFVREVHAQIAEWKARLIRYRNERKKVVVWGGGSKAVGFLTQVAQLGAIEYICDINPNMAGNCIPGIGMTYVAPDFLAEYNPDVVIVMNSVYSKEVESLLGEMGLYPEIAGL